MIALRADRIFDGEQLLDENVVLLDDCKVVAVTRDDVPPDVPVRDLPGTTILPGLIDAHVHLTADAGPGALDRLGSLRIAAETAGLAATRRALAATIEQSLRRHLAAGVTTVRDLGDPFDAVLKWRKQAPASLPAVVASGTPLTRKGGHCWSLGGEVTGVDEIRAAVRARAENGADVIKIMASGGAFTPGTDTMSPQFTDDELAAAVAEARAIGLPITAHAHALAAVRQAAEMGVDGIEHCTCLTPDGVVIDNELLTALDGIAVCGTLGSDRSIVVPPHILEMVAKAGISEAGLQQAVRRLYDGGVRIIAGSDGGIGPAKPHGLLPATLAEYVEAGLPPTAALVAGTSSAADALRVNKGRIRPGADADLLVVPGDPTRDITTLARPTVVYLAGWEVTPGG
ncbi:metal-dependent hydrolase family protein [Kribbella speibonae]|uniref:Amidohydrolase family protein n=1 Tax=Kribbella speibonae TaxID=1572660 RepID=A0A4R0I942_9ACTN|nr:amidohydrolase family protein [Kribbella speibonae]TCC27934.1 amidohydrolase family protein [Kribbella speibonae]TCC29493.1 amidohydrolase family protein [Kribbella speibonae]